MKTRLWSGLINKASTRESIPDSLDLFPTRNKFEACQQIEDREKRKTTKLFPPFQLLPGWMMRDDPGFVFGEISEMSVIVALSITQRRKLNFSHHSSSSFFLLPENCCNVCLFLLLVVAYVCKGFGD